MTSCQTNAASASDTRTTPRVLVVEDDAATAMIAKALCEELGAQVTLAGNGQRAVELFERETFSLVLMDLEMPIMGGFEAAYEMRAIERLRAGDPVVIIAVTGHDSLKIQRQCLQAGMQRCVTKPYTIELTKGLLASIGYHHDKSLPSTSSAKA